MKYRKAHLLNVPRLIWKSSAFGTEFLAWRAIYGGDHNNGSIVSHQGNIGQDIRGLEIRHKSLTRGPAAMADH
jgi:hypothetical protein